MHDDMPMPSGFWWLPRWARGYLTYRSIRRELANDRSDAGWNTSGRKAGEIEAEARTTAQLIMEAHG